MGLDYANKRNLLHRHYYALAAAVTLDARTLSGLKAQITKVAKEIEEQSETWDLETHDYKVCLEANPTVNM